MKYFIRVYSIKNIYVWTSRCSENVISCRKSNYLTQTSSKSTAHMTKRKKKDHNFVRLRAPTSKIPSKNNRVLNHYFNLSEKAGAVFPAAADFTRECISGTVSERLPLQVSRLNDYSPTPRRLNQERCLHSVTKPQQQRLLKCDNSW